MTQFLDKYKRESPQRQALLAAGAITCTYAAFSLGRYCYNQFRYGSRPEIYCEITGDINQSKGMVIFIHGFPDFGYIWESQIKLLSQRGYCCVNLELPNFHIDRIQNAYGYDFFSVVDALGEKIASLTNEGQHRCNLVTHGMN